MHTSQFQKFDPYDWFCAPGSHSSDTSVFNPEPQESFRSSLSLMIHNTSELLLTVIRERADGPAEAEYDPVRPARPLLENKAGQTDAGAGVRDQS